MIKRTGGDHQAFEPGTDSEAVSDLHCLNRTYHREVQDTSGHAPAGFEKIVVNQVLFQKSRPQVLATSAPGPHAY